MPSEYATWEDEYHARAKVLFNMAYDLAFRVLHSSGEAADVANHAVSHGFARWGKLRRDNDGLDRWIATTAINKAVDVWRSARWRRNVNLEFVQEELNGDFAGRLVDYLDLIAAMKQLRHEDQQLIILRYYAGVSAADTAAMLGRTVTWVTTRCSLVRGQLAQTLAVPDDNVTPESCRA